MARHDTEPRTLESLCTHLVVSGLSTAAALLLILCVALFVPLFVRLGSGASIDDQVLGVANRLLFLHDNFWPVALVSLLAPCMSSYVLYRRMCQPLVRFRGVFAELSEGRVPGPVRLRGRDYLAAEAAALNHMLDSLCSRAEELARLRTELAECLAEFQDLEGVAGEQLQRRYKELDGRLGSLLTAG